jgi:glutamyl-Q tRNA(Asp) synthetase
MSKNTDIIGRFAPSPSGPLHFGSLVAATASYLDARHRQGRWLLRMEDLDPAREPPEAANQILRALESHGLHWDGPVLYQSSRLDVYAEVLAQLRQQGRLFACRCSRQQIQAEGGIYDGRCRALGLQDTGNAIRVRVDDVHVSFTDSIQGSQSQCLLQECGDFILRRKDGLFAYQLAVVVDDAFQGVSDIVRGSDLLDSTARQIFLQQLLGLPKPRYAHVPVAVNGQGHKLSKQHFAQALSLQDCSAALLQALRFLGQPVEPALTGAGVDEILAWAVPRWDIQAVPKLANIRLESYS